MTFKQSSERDKGETCVKIIQPEGKGYLSLEFRRRLETRNRNLEVITLKLNLKIWVWKRSTKE